MGDFDNYAEQGLQFGRTVAYEVTELFNPDGSHPIVHLEHLGDANASVLEEAFAMASGKDEREVKRKGSIEEHADERAAAIKHTVKRIENVFFRDGRAATDADLPAFIRAMPVPAFNRMMRFALNEKNFCKHQIAEKASVLAEK